MPAGPLSELLRAEHRAIKTDLERLQELLAHPSQSRLAETQRLFQELRRLTAAHLGKEERWLFPRLRPAFPELLARMEEQHEYCRQFEHGLKELLAGEAPLDGPRIAELDRFGRQYQAALRHHLIEEEDYLLPLAEAELSLVEQQALLEQMQEAP